MTDSMTVLTCHSIIVCSNLGPLIAFALGCWLGDHIAARLGACNCRRLSPSSGNSCRGASLAPPASSSRALVADTFWGAGFGEGSLGWILSSPEERHWVAMKVRREGRVILLTAEAAPDLPAIIIKKRDASNCKRALDRKLEALWSTTWLTRSNDHSAGEITTGCAKPLPNYLRVLQ
jgi:hypothetical protein